MFFKSTNGASSRVDLANLKITDARVGDTLSIAGAGDDLSDLDVTVDKHVVFEAGNRKWFELSGPYRERRVWIEVDPAEEVQVRAVLDGRHLTLDQLGLSEDDLGEMDQRQNPADSFEFEGKVWLFRSSREMGMFTDGAVQGNGFYAWQFQEEKGNRLLTVRKFEGEPFTAMIATSIHPGDITVYRGQ